jgi:hypothetical protein
MWTPLAECAEYDPPRPSAAPPPIRAALEPVDYRILTYLFQGLKTGKIATKLGRSTLEVAARIDRFAFRRLQAEVEAGVVKGIMAASTTEPVTLAKAAAPSAMRQVVKLAHTSQDPRTRLHASKAVLSYAGVEPPRRIEITTPERVLDQMTAEELARFAERRIWPERFRDLLRAFLPAPKDVTPPALETTARPVPPAPEAGGDDERHLPGGRHTAYDPDPGEPDPDD